MWSRCNVRKNCLFQAWRCGPTVTGPARLACHFRPSRLSLSCVETSGMGYLGQLVLYKMWPKFKLHYPLPNSIIVYRWILKVGLRHWNFMLQASFLKAVFPEPVSLKCVCVCVCSFLGILTSHSVTLANLRMEWDLVMILLQFFYPQTPLRILIILIVEAISWSTQPVTPPIPFVLTMAAATITSYWDVTSDFLAGLGGSVGSMRFSFKMDVRLIMLR